MPKAWARGPKKSEIFHRSGCCRFLHIYQNCNCSGAVRWMKQNRYMASHKLLVYIILEGDRRGFLLFSVRVQLFCIRWIWRHYSVNNTHRKKRTINESPNKQKKNNNNSNDSPETNGIKLWVCVVTMATKRRNDGRNLLLTPDPITVVTFCSPSGIG